MRASPDSEEYFTCLAQYNLKPHLLTAGGNKGSIALLDARNFPTTKSVQSLKPKSGRNAKSIVLKYTSADGGISSIDTCNPVGKTPGLMACTGIDRKLRVFELETGKMSHSVYLKSKLKKLKLVPDCDFVSEMERISDEQQAKKRALEEDESQVTCLDDEVNAEEMAKRQKQDDLWEQLVAFS